MKVQIQSSVKSARAEVLRAAGIAGLDPNLEHAEARSCLAALTDSTNDEAASAPFDRILIELDRITVDVGPSASR